MRFCSENAAFIVFLSLFFSSFIENVFHIMAFVVMWLLLWLAECLWGYYSSGGKHKAGSLQSLGERHDYVKIIIFPDQTRLSLSWVLCRELFLFFFFFCLCLCIVRINFSEGEISIS